MRDALAALDQGICVIGADERIVTLNGRCREILALPDGVGEPGGNCDDVFGFLAARGDFGAGDPADLAAQQLGFLRAGGAGHLEWKLAGGSQVEVNHKSLPQGGCVCMLTDVTSLRQADEALREAEERFRTLVEHAPEAVILLDEKATCFVDANPRALELFGYSREELRAIDPLEVSPPFQEDGTPTRRMAMQVIRDTIAGKTPCFEWLYRHRDGRIIPCEVRLVRIMLHGEPHVRGSVIDLTQRRREAELSQRLGRILDASHNEIYVFDARSGRVLQANGGARRNLGYSMKELRVLAAWDLLADLGEQECRDLLKPLLTGEKDLVNFETLHERKDGTTYPVEAHVQLFRQEEPPLCVAIVMDITERRRTEAELQEHRQRLRDLASSSADWFWETDAEHRFIYLSPNFEDIAGGPRERFYGKRRDLLQLLEGDAADWAGHLEDLEARRPFRDFTYRHDIGGKTMWVCTSGVPYFDAEGNFCGYRGIGRDVTALKEVEARNRQTERSFRDVVEGSIQGLYIHRDWKLLFANQAQADLLGYDSVEELSEIDDIAAFFDPEDLPRLKAISKARMEGGDAPSRYEIRYVRKDGRRFWVEHLARTVEWEGKPAIQATIIDIDERKNSETAIHRAKEAAEAASKAKSDFLALMSHELRTPLNAILGFSEIIRDGVFGPVGNEAYVEYARDINDSGAHLLEIINDILDISKIESGRERLEEKPVSLNALLEACYRLIRPRAVEGEVRVVMPETSQDFRIRVDPTRLKQVLINLLNNAVKFTLPGGTVTVDTEATPDAGLCIAVSDTGIGIRPEDMETVLMPFGQVESAVARKYQGTGLGLPLAKALTELHGGRLELESIAGVGTVVRVHLPAERLASDDARELVAANR